MNVLRIIDNLSRRPGALGVGDSIGSSLPYFYGWDEAVGGKLFSGFHGWLLDKNGGFGRNLGISDLLASVTGYPLGEYPYLLSKEDAVAANEKFLALLQDFFPSDLDMPPANKAPEDFIPFVHIMRRAPEALGLDFSSRAGFAFYYGCDYSGAGSVVSGKFHDFLVKKNKGRGANLAESPLIQTIAKFEPREFSYVLEGSDSLRLQGIFLNLLEECLLK